MKNNFLKTLIVLILSFTALLFVFSCSKKESSEDNVVRVGFYADAHYQIWNPIASNLAKEGIILELVSFANTRMPNQALNNGDIDLNAFQHHAYFNDEVKNNGYDIVPIADTFIVVMNIYSQKISNVSELKKGDKVAIPNDPSNEGRALKVLEAAGLIKLKNNAPDNPEVSDIGQNPLNLEIIEVDAGGIYRLLPDVACAVINCNYALDFGLNPGSDYIFQDDPTIYKGNSFVNLIAARTKDKDKEVFKKIIKAYKTDMVKEIYAKNFKGSFIATW